MEKKKQESEECYEHLSVINNENTFDLKNLKDIKFEMKKTLQIYFRKICNYESTKNISKEILKIYLNHKKEDNNELAQSIFDYGKSLINLSEFLKSHKIMIVAYKMRKRLYKDADHSETATSLNSLAVSYTRLGDDRTTLKYDLQAYEMRKRLYKDADHSETATSLNNLDQSKSKQI